MADVKAALARLEARGGWDEADLNDFAILEGLIGQLEAKERECIDWESTARQERDEVARLQEQMEAYERLAVACRHYQSDDIESWRSVVHALDAIADVSNPAKRPT